MASQHPFNFPFPPYGVQKELMGQLYQTCEEGGVGIFESPTGTGKSLSVICSTLLWRRQAEEARLQALRDEAEAGTGGSNAGGHSERAISESTSTPATDDDEPDWLKDWGTEEKKEESNTRLARLERAQQRLQDRLSSSAPLSGTVACRYGHASG